MVKLFCIRIENIHNGEIIFYIDGVIIYENINLDDRAKILDAGCGYGFDLKRINLLNESQHMI